MNNNINKFWEAMENNSMTAEDVANLFTNYHGNQLLSDEFMEFVADEGYTIEGLEEDEEEED